MSKCGSVFVDDDFFVNSDFFIVSIAISKGDWVVEFPTAVLLCGLVEMFLRILKADSLLGLAAVSTLSGDGANRTFVVALLCGVQVVLVNLYVVMSFVSYVVQVNALTMRINIFRIRQHAASTVFVFNSSDDSLLNEWKVG